MVGWVGAGVAVCLFQLSALICSKSGVGGRRRGHKKKTWTDEAMEDAVKAVQEDMSFYRAAREFDVPKATLYRHVYGVCWYRSTFVHLKCFVFPAWKFDYYYFMFSYSLFMLSYVFNCVLFSSCVWMK